MESLPPRLRATPGRHAAEPPRRVPAGEAAVRPDAPGRPHLVRALDGAAAVLDILQRYPDPRDPPARAGAHPRGGQRSSRTRSEVRAVSVPKTSFSGFPATSINSRTVRLPSQRGSRCASQVWSSTSLRLKEGSWLGVGRARAGISRLSRSGL